MTREEKAQVIDELTEKFSSTENFYLADASGFTVHQINQFRRLCFEKGLEYKVYKNTLIKKALDKQEGDFSDFDKEGVLTGYSGIIFGTEAANLPAKAIKEFRKLGLVEDMPRLKAASIENELFIGDEHLSALSELKSKTELIGDVILLLQSPIKSVLASLDSGKQNVAGIVKALSEREPAESES